MLSILDDTESRCSSGGSCLSHEAGASQGAIEAKGIPARVDDTHEEELVLGSSTGAGGIHASCCPIEHGLLSDVHPRWPGGAAEHGRGYTPAPRFAAADLVEGLELRDRPLLAPRCGIVGSWQLKHGPSAALCVLEMSCVDARVCIETLVCVRPSAHPFRMKVELLVEDDFKLVAWLPLGMTAGDGCEDSTTLDASLSLGCIITGEEADETADRRQLV